MSLGPWQIVIIALVLVLLFGAGRLGKMGKGMGEGIRDFKKAFKGDAHDAPKESGKDSEA